MPADEDEGWIQFGLSRYFFSFDASTKLTFSSAINFCKERNSHLAQTESRRETSYIGYRVKLAEDGNKIPADSRVFIGLMRDTAKWANSGTEANNLMWCPGEPSNSDGSVLLKDDCWLSAPDSAHQDYFVCESKFISFVWISQIAITKLPIFSRVECQPTEESGYKWIKGRFYKVYKTVQLYERAKSICENDGATLPMMLEDNDNLGMRQARKCL